MHEVGMMQNILDMAIYQANQNNASKIDLLTINVGELSGVTPEALELAWEVLSPGTIAENAHLEINSIPVVCHCQQCDRDFQPEKYLYECPQCRQISSNIIAGKDLNLVSVEVS